MAPLSLADEPDEPRRPLAGRGRVWVAPGHGHKRSAAPQSPVGRPGAPLPETSLRERKKRATRRALRAAGLRLVAERGYSNVTVEDIAEAAQVSPRTFFNYFPSKEAAVLGSGPERAEELRRRIAEQPPASSPLEAVWAVFREEAMALSEELGELGGETAEWLDLMKRAHLDPSLAGVSASHMISFERAVAAGVAERLGSNAGCSPYGTLLGCTVGGLARAVMRIWAESGGAVALEQIVDSAFEALSQGLPPRWAPCEAQQERPDRVSSRKSRQ
jgi:AcrR family transcriptional regulator